MKLNGNIGGTLGHKKNQLVYELLNERLSPWMEPVDLSFSEDVQFGIDNEPVARSYTVNKLGIQFEEVGAIISDSQVHHSPALRQAICKIWPQTPLKGVDKEHISQCINASDEVKEVHWVSFCPIDLNGQ